jgi:hypothetical protein
MPARMRAGRFAAAFVALAASLGAGPAHASPEDLFGYGARTSAMGATGVAHATGYETGWHNPALASETRANKLTLGYLGGLFRLDARQGGVSSPVSPAPVKGALIGAALPIPLGGVLADRVGASLAFYTPTDVIVRGRVLYPEKTQFPLLSDRAQSLTLRAALGADMGYGVKVGVGVAALAEIAGTVVAAADATGNVGTSVETQLVATYSPVLGATYDLPISGDATYRVGLVYRGTLDARFAVVIDGTRLSSLAIPLFNISGLAQYDPAQVALELARAEGDNVLAVQVVYKRWSAFPGLLEPTVVCTEGGAGACGVLPPRIDWDDTLVVRVGADQGFFIARGARLHARGGAFVEQSPLPSSLPTSEAYDRTASATVDVPTAYYDATRVALTAGTGLSLAEPLPPIDLDLFGQYHVLLPRTVRSVNAGGTTLLEGEVSGRVAVFGMTAGVRF